MSFSFWFSGVQKTRVRKTARHAKRAYVFAETQIEQLEARVVPYVTTGNLWPHPELVTISFAPDGTNDGGMSSNLFSVFNAKFGSATAWQNQILKAAQVWAQQTNINFTVVSDNGADEGSGNYQQGDPGFGDIRIFGYDFGDSTLAGAALPPPINNYSIAGDIDFNTAQTWNIGSNYDLFTVAMHEIGHSLGLDHSTDPAAVMYPYYGGVDSGLASDDINGIRDIYSADAARSADQYDAVASNGTFSTATTVTINPQFNTALVTNVDITTTADLDYYKVTVPTSVPYNQNMRIHVQSTGLSLLAPKMWLYDANFNQLQTAAYAGYRGGTLTINQPVVPGATYYVKVDGFNDLANGTGKYAVTINVGTGSDPTVPLPNTQTLNGDPLSSGGGLPMVCAFPASQHPGHDQGHGNSSADDDLGSDSGNDSDETVASATLSDLCFELPNAAINAALDGLIS